MGIKGLNKLITKYSPLSISTVNLVDLKGKKIAIDSELLLHKFRNYDNSKNSHIFGFINNINIFLKNGILPVYVFDGVPSVAKQKNAILKRTQTKEFINKKIEELENEFIEKLNKKKPFEFIDSDINEILDKLQKNQTKISSVTKDHRKECKYLLKLLGIPYIVANEDAEALCVSLQFNGIVDYVYSDDTDVIPYFVSCYKDHQTITTEITILRGKLVDSVFESVSVNKILEDFDMTPREFVDMCILCGCDFCEGIFKIGPNNAYKFIKDYNNIENLKDILNYDESFNYTDARNVFYKDHNLPISNIELGTIKYDELVLYLRNERNINPLPIIDKYSKIYDIYKKKLIDQSNIHSFSSGINIEIC